MIHRTLCVAIVLLVIACDGPPKDPPIRPVRSMVVADAPEFEDLWWPGRAQAAQELELSFEVAGKLVELSIKEGDEVTEGTVMARVDPRDFEAALRRARAELGRAQALLERVRAAGRAVAAQDLTDARARYDQALAQVEIQRKAVEDTQIVAPFAGIVARTYFDNFQNVRREEPVIRFLDVSTLEMVIQIPEDGITLLDRVESGRVRFDAFPGVEIPAEISEVSREASRATRTYPVTLTFEPTIDAPVQPGMAGEASGEVVDRTGVEEGSIEIPIAAVFPDEGSSSQQSFVWVIDEASGTVSRRAVEPRGFTEDGILVGGLVAGDRIATAGTHVLRDGQKVRVP